MAEVTFPPLLPRAVTDVVGTIVNWQEHPPEEGEEPVFVDALVLGARWAGNVAGVQASTEMVQLLMQRPGDSTMRWSTPYWLSVFTDLG